MSIATKGKGKNLVCRIHNSRDIIFARLLSFGKVFN
jgi:hypothetical protein